MFEEISEDTLQDMIDKGVKVFDIRRKDEFLSTGIIEKSIPLTFFDETGAHDIENWMNEFNKHVISKDQEIVLICARANRTKAVGDFLSKQMNYAKVYDLRGGISSWIGKGLKTVEFK